MNVSFLFGIAVGCCVGALGQYYVQKFIANRQQVKKIRNKKNELNVLFDSYPDFMSAIKNNINDPDYKNIREFFVVDKSALMNSSIPRLRYNLSEEILPILRSLSELGFIEQIPNDSLLYKMNVEFIAALKSH